MSEDDRCEARVAEPPHYFHSHQCERKGKTVVGGMILCTQHGKLAEKRGLAYVS